MTTSAPGAKTTQSTKPTSWYGKLWVQVLIAMAAGIALGHFFPDFGVRMQPLGDAFIKAIRVLIAPIIFCTVVHGIARMADLARVGRVALKTLIYFEVVTTLALIIGLAAVNIWQPGVGMNVNLATVDTSTIKPFVTQTQNQGVVSFLMNIIPSTFIGAFAEGNVLQVLLLAVVCGFALTWLRDAGKPVLDLIDVISHAFPDSEDRHVDCASGRFWRDCLHGWEVRHGIAVIAWQTYSGFLPDVPHLHRYCSVANCTLLRL